MFGRGSQKTEKQGLWAKIRRGWISSIFLGLLILILPFKDIIWSLIKAPQMLEQLSSASPFWQAVVKNGLTDNLGGVFESVLPYLIVIGGSVLFSYAIVSGYFMTYRALESNNNPITGMQRKASEITISNILLRSLIVNVPILYWAIFLFIGLPQLIKLPIASLSTGSITTLVFACIAMVIAAILATHIGKTLARMSLQFMAQAK